MTEQMPSAMLPDVSADFQGRYEKLRTDLESLQRNLESLEETAYSADGLVQATIGPRGELIKLVLDPRVFRTSDAEALATSITETVHDATAAVTERIVELTKPMLPTSTTVLDDSGAGLGPVLQKITGRPGAL